MQGIYNTETGPRSIKHNVFALLLIVMIGSMLSGCGLLQKFGILSAPAPVPAAPLPAPIPLAEQPYTLNLRLLASSGLNPNTQSKPSPVQVRVFVMQPQADIADKGFEELFDYSGNFMDPRPMSTLTLKPGQKKNIELPANKSQSMLVIAAAYREPYQGLWKATAMIEPTDEVSVRATIGATTVTIHPSR